MIGSVSRVSPVHTAMRNCTRDEGGPFEVGNQVLNRLEHQLPINAAEIGFYVEIEHPVVAPTALTILAHGIDRRFAGPVAIGVGMEHRLQTGLQVATGNFLGDSYGYRSEEHTSEL